MGLFDRGKGQSDEQLRESGTRVPAQLVKRKESKWERRGGGSSLSLGGVGSSGDEYKGRKTTMTWEAHLPDGKAIEFQEEALWGPQEGQWLEAACDDECENAVLILDLASMNWIDDDQEKIMRHLRVSARRAEALRDGTAAPSEGELADVDGKPTKGTSLQDALGG
jgi:hypothetical protein